MNPTRPRSAATNPLSPRALPASSPRASLVTAALALCLASSVLGGCNDYHLVSLRAAFTISWPVEQGFDRDSLPDSQLAFGMVSTGSVESIVVRLGNPGLSNLDICDIYLAHVDFDETGALVNELRLDTDPELSTNGTHPDMVIPRRASLDVKVRFASLYGTKIDGGRYLVVKHELNSNCAAGAGAPLYIPLDGQGFGDPAPDIYATPALIDFGAVRLDDTASVELTVGNAGPGLLEVGSVTLAGADADQFQLLAGDVADNDFETAEAGYLEVVFAPDHQGHHAAELVIESNDPDEHPLSIPLAAVANPAPLGDGPIAVCAADILSTTQAWPSFDGSASWDSVGLPLTYWWVLTPPLGSAAVLLSPDQPTTPLQLDLAGTYTAELTVTNTDNQQSSCTQNIEAVPYENFRVELFWSVPDDMDLHLLSPQASPGNGPHSAPYDCHYGNMKPDWGVPVYPLDDPSLDLDDIDDLGPENINIVNPAVGPYSGSYQVFVHDYPDTVEFYPANDVTVRIYLNGTLTKTYQFSISGENSDYYVAKIDWPSGQVTDCNGLAGCP